MDLKNTAILDLNEYYELRNRYERLIGSFSLSEETNVFKLQMDVDVAVDVLKEAMRKSSYNVDNVCIDKPSYTNKVIIGEYGLSAKLMADENEQGVIEWEIIQISWFLTV